MVYIKYIWAQGTQGRGPPTPPPQARAKRAETKRVRPRTLALPPTPHPSLLHINIHPLPPHEHVMRAVAGGPPFFLRRLRLWCVLLILGLPRAPIETIMTPCLYALAAASVRAPHFKLTEGIH